MAARILFRWRIFVGRVPALVARARWTSWATSTKIRKSRCRPRHLNSSNSSAWAAMPSSRSGRTAITREFIPLNICCASPLQNKKRRAGQARRWCPQQNLRQNPHAVELHLPGVVVVKFHVRAGAGVGGNGRPGAREQARGTFNRVLLAADRRPMKGRGGAGRRGGPGMHAGKVIGGVGINAGHELFPVADAIARRTGIGEREVVVDGAKPTHTPRIRDAVAKAGVGMTAQSNEAGERLLRERSQAVRRGGRVVKM